MTTASVAAAAAPAVLAACDALERCTAALAWSLGRVRAPDAPAIGVWSVAEVATHLAQSAPAFLDTARGAIEPEVLADNATDTVRAVAADPDRDLGSLARRIVAGDEALVAYARGAVGDPPVSPFRGLTVPLSALLGLELGEILVHGFDITRAAGLPWPIDPRDAAIALEGAVQVLPLMLDADAATGVELRCDVRIRHGSRHVVVVRDGALQVLAPSAEPVDCHVSVDPVDFLLVSFERIGPLRPLLTGKVLVWGRRPAAFTELQSVLRTV
ncbi:MAG: hypothetical protein R2726_16895 [Acidimicrobiales bacterium]